MGLLRIAHAGFNCDIAHPVSPTGEEGRKRVSAISQTAEVGRLRAPANDPMRPHKVPKTKGAAPPAL